MMVSVLVAFSAAVGFVLWLTRLAQPLASG
jgi:hypothetical protein